MPTTLVWMNVGRAVDRAVDVAFGREVHHRVGLVRREHLPHRRGVGDVGADQDVAVVRPRLLQRVLGGGVGHLVDVDHHVVGVADQVADHGGADEPAAAGQQDLHSFSAPNSLREILYSFCTQKPKGLTTTLADYG